jgi:hypothetical protein
MLIDGHGIAAADGFPIAAKLVQALRMLAASASWSAFSGVACGAFG